MEITGPDLATEEWLNDLVVPLHCQYDGSTGHKLSILSYFKTDESGLKTNCPLDISLDLSRPPSGSPLTWPGPNPKASPTGLVVAPCPTAVTQVVAVTQVSAPWTGGSEACALVSRGWSTSLTDVPSGGRCPLCLTGPSAGSTCLEDSASCWEA